MSDGRVTLRPTSKFKSPAVRTLAIWIFCIIIAAGGGALFIAFGREILEFGHKAYEGLFDSDSHK